MLYLIMWVHLTGCLWYIIIKQDNEWLPVPDYITKTTDLYETSIWGKYFVSFYHAVWLLTGGEVGPRDNMQTSMASVLIIVGALITAVMFGEMAVLMSNLSQRSTKFQTLLDGSLTTMQNMHLPSYLINKILDYITTA